MKSILAATLIVPFVLSEGPVTTSSGLEGIGEFLEGFGVDSINDLITGTYEFEMFGRPHRLYICDEDNSDNALAPGEPSSSPDQVLYWAVTDTTTNEYTIAVGRDENGFVADEGSAVPRLVSRCDIFRLYGDKVLKGYYEIAMELVEGNEGQLPIRFTLSEHFPEYSALQADTELINVYEMFKLSPAIVGNPDLEGHQCFHPLGYDIFEIPLPSLWTSDFRPEDDGFRSFMIEPGAFTSCWKVDNEFNDTMEAGYLYGYDFEWDGSLLLERFDSVNKNAGCSDLALVTYQCEDKKTGATMLMHLKAAEEDQVLEDMRCPFPVSEPLECITNAHCKDDETCYEGECVVAD